MARFALIMMAAGLLLMPIFGLDQPGGEQPQRPREPFAGDRLPGAAPPDQEEKAGFAADRLPARPAAFQPQEAAKPLAIDGKRAMKYLEDICAIGPRISGSTGMKKQQELLIKHFEGFGAKVHKQEFTARQLSRPAPVDMTNLIVSWHPERKRRVILCSHYDTRPIADQEPDERKWREKFVSANDGGSGVALLMELAHHMKDLQTACGVDFVFFDGEEYIWDPRPDTDRYFFGSDFFAQAWRKNKRQPHYVAAVLLDMIAGKNSRFPVEGFSWQRANVLCRDLWKIAAELKCRAFIDQVGEKVQDDHIALQKAGIPAIDIIDFSYPHWHRLSDVPENCSADGLDQVARVLGVWLGRVR